ncbi:MAG: hypothetical protein LBV69_07285 [Bacteroidales bacterium]|jgi:hypothetical protein|nr:hypothetical protein [Bacteroidales bacterium]
MFKFTYYNAHNNGITAKLLEKGLWGKIKYALEEFDMNLNACMRSSTGQIFPPNGGGNLLTQGRYIWTAPASAAWNFADCVWNLVF